MQPDAPRRIGVFGGTFDPPHVGHLIAARNAIHVLGLDLLLFVVAFEPWQKVAERFVTDPSHRLAMVEAAVADMDRVEVCTLELSRGGPSYTADTLAELDAQYPEAEMVVLVGADAAKSMPTWKRFDEVLEHCTVAMIDRPVGEEPVSGTDALPDWVDARVRIPLVGISSTELRRRVAAGEPLDYLVPPAVVSVIGARGLYRERSV